jgi:hypothetical protein
MSDLIENQSFEQGSEAQALESLFNTYKERNEKKKKFDADEAKKKYFTPQKDTEYFRGLPRIGNEKPIEEAYFHKIKDGTKPYANVTVYCPAKNNPKVQAKDKDGNLVFDQNNKPVMVAQECPLCKREKYYRGKVNSEIFAQTKGKKAEELTAEQTKARNEAKDWLKKAGEWEAKLYYIVRGVDRNNEGHGVKFWRFKHNYKNQGVKDKLTATIESVYKDSGRIFSDPVNGYDFLITVVNNTTPNGITYRDVSAINSRTPKPLHTDEAILKSWLEDKTTWRDVFKPKKLKGCDELTYLKLAAEGNTPYYDKDQKKYIYPGHPDLEAAANTKSQNLDADDEDYSMYEDADPEDMATQGGLIGAVGQVFSQSNAPDITKMSTTIQEVKTFDHGASEIVPQSNGTPSGTQAPGASPYDDLPF